MINSGYFFMNQIFHTFALTWQSADNETSSPYSSMRKPPIIKSPLVPRKYCVNLFGTLWTRDTSWIDRFIINHERIHTAQQRELLFVPFYLLYIIEWLVRLLIYRNSDSAYRNISFEREAYTHGNDLTYLSSRRRFAWLRFLRPFFSKKSS